MCTRHCWYKKECYASAQSFSEIQNLNNDISKTKISNHHIWEQSLGYGSKASLELPTR